MLPNRWTHLLHLCVLHGSSPLQEHLIIFSKASGANGVLGGSIIAVKEFNPSSLYHPSSVGGGSAFKEVFQISTWIRSHTTFWNRALSVGGRDWSLGALAMFLLTFFIHRLYLASFAGCEASSYFIKHLTSSSIHRPCSAIAEAYSLCISHLLLRFVLLVCFSHCLDFLLNRAMKWCRPPSFKAVHFIGCNGNGLVNIYLRIIDHLFQWLCLPGHSQGAVLDEGDWYTFQSYPSGHSCQFHLFWFILWNPPRGSTVKTLHCHKWYSGLTWCCW